MGAPLLRGLRKGGVTMVGHLHNTKGSILRIVGFGSSGDLEVVFSPHLLEDAEKYIASMFGAEQRLSPITTAGDEVQIAKTVDPCQARGHGAEL